MTLSLGTLFRRGERVRQTPPLPLAFDQTTQAYTPSLIPTEHSQRWEFSSYMSEVKNCVYITHELGWHVSIPGASVYYHYPRNTVDLEFHPTGSDFSTDIIIGALRCRYRDLVRLNSPFPSNYWSCSNPAGLEIIIKFLGPVLEWRDPASINNEESTRRIIT